MDFSRLSEQDLEDFIRKFRTRAYQKYKPSSAMLGREQEAARLFEISKQIPNFAYPLPIIDLYLASQYTGPLDKQYPIAQIQNLTEADINYLDQFFHFGASQNSLKVNRERVIRIFRYLGILDETGLSESSLQMLLTGPVWEQLQKNLSEEDAKSLLVNTNIVQCGLSMNFSDPNGFISELPCRDYHDLKLISLIKEYGSGVVLIMAIYLGQHELMRKLLKAGVPADFYYGSKVTLSYSSSSGSTPLLTAITYQDLIAAEILIKAGADVNGYQLDKSLINTETFNPQSEIPLFKSLVDMPLLTGQFEGAEIIVNPSLELLHKYRTRDYSNDFNIQQQQIIRDHEHDHEPDGVLFFKLTRIYPLINIGDIQRIIAKIRVLQSPDYQVPQLHPVFLWKFGPGGNQEKTSSAEMLRLLLISGADPNKSPCLLMLAMTISHSNVVKMLIEFGANPNQICKQFGGRGRETKINTPLSQAVVKKDFDIFRYLLDHGADPSISTIDDEPLLKYTRKKRMTNFTKLLIN